MYTTRDRKGHFLGHGNVHDLEFEGHALKIVYLFAPSKGAKILKKIISLAQKIFEIETISYVGVKIYPHIPLTS